MNSVWAKTAKASADSVRVKHFLEIVAATSAGPALEKPSSEQATILASVFAGSPALSNLLAANPAWLEMLQPEALKNPRRKEGLRREVLGWLEPLLEQRSFTEGFRRLRQFKQREMLRVAARDLARLAEATEIIQEISDIADVCLESVWQLCYRQLTDRYGQPFHQDGSGLWQKTAACAIGLGKLGGQELNYSSDVDLIFVYSEEGSVFREPPRSRSRPQNPVITNHQFFNRLAEAIVAEMTQMPPEGMLYRIDLRLRPEGDAGPLSRSMEGYENYYAQWGQTWERMMLIKGRGVAGDASLAHEFLEMVQPFRYPRSMTGGVLHEIAAMKDRIEEEVIRSGELERNIKLGPGGIREIEFIVQAQQLLHAGRQPFLQMAQTVPCLDKLVQYGLLLPKQAQQLREAYCFLRALEHRLQMESNLQTHTIPAGRQARERLARLMGFSSLSQFESALTSHTSNTRRMFHGLFKAERQVERPPGPFPREFQGHEALWKKFLMAHNFRDVEKAFRILREFVEGPGYVHVSERTSKLAYELLPRLFAMCPAKSAEFRVSSDGVPRQIGRAHV